MDYKLTLTANWNETIQTTYTTLRAACLALAQQKQQNPLESVTRSADFSDAMTTVENLKATVASYNTAVQTANAAIATKKQTAGSRDLAKTKEELASLEAARDRHKPNVDTACKAYQAALSTKAQLDSQKAQAKRHLNQYCANVLNAYQQSINDYLDNFSTGFRISNTRHSYAGGKPSSQFQIVINDTELDLGSEKTPSGTPCFKTALSAGDRSALALAFFLASLDHDPSLKDKIVILDDPFTSLDRFRRTCTAQRIRRLATEVRQVIVLSHDPLFLKLVCDEYNASAIRSLQLARAGDSSVISTWDVVAETQSTYMKNYSALLAFYQERRGDKRAVALAIRPFLEGLLRVRFPGHFRDNEWLGQLLDKIRNADNSNGLWHARADLRHLEDINDYSKKYHHDQNPNADSEPISDDELHGFVKRTLKLVGGC